MYKTKNNKGQLAIFIALIFQFVFVLFAMLLNVALVVHDKINLQNSVDIAAYYGAMKQAQTLNAIAHINYQIRQTWKLYAWRYHVMGNPYAVKRGCLGNDEAQLCDPIPGNPRITRGKYVFCTSAYNAEGKLGWLAFRLPGTPQDNKWEPDSGKDDEFCKDPVLQIPDLAVPPVSQWNPVLTRAFEEVTRKAIEDVEKRCKAYAYTNWLFALFSLYHFRVDQSRKAKLIYKIANELAREGKDLEGTQIYDGARNTFKKNLTYINHKAYNNNSFKTFNSLEETDPISWLDPEGFYVYPSVYVQPEAIEESCKGELAWINKKPHGASSEMKELADHLIAHRNFSGLCQYDNKPHNFCEASAGLSKKENFIIYYGVKAELEYKNQIFLPFFENSSITLKAQGFAKPFGGRIGPKGEDDPRLPQSYQPGSRVNVDTAIENAPNYSKYPGDTHGLKSQYVQSKWASKIYDSSRSHKSIENYLPDSLMNSNQAPKSPLSEGSVSRKWEIAATAPDLFDITYFTILPSYMDTYYKKLNKLKDKLGWQVAPDFTGTTTSGIATPDFGGIEGVKRQVPSSPYSVGIWPVQFNPVSELQAQNLFYVIKQLKHLMTGWNPSQIKYTKQYRYPVADDTKSTFGQCKTWDYEMEPVQDDDKGRDARIPTGCVTGGRTGYSVKMISKEYLEQTIGSTPVPNSSWNW